MNTNFLFAFAPLALVAAVPASAVAFTPTQAQLLNLVVDGDNGTIVTKTTGPDNTGIDLTVDVADKDGFSQLQLQSNNFNTDLSGFDSLEVEVERGLATTGINSGRFFIKTGSGFAFQSGANFQFAAGVPSVASFDLTAATGDLTDVRAFGFQFFGADGGSVGQTLSIRPTAIPEPASLAAFGLLGGAALLRRRRSQA